MTSARKFIQGKFRGCVLNVQSGRKKDRLTLACGKTLQAATFLPFPHDLFAADIINILITRSAINDSCACTRCARTVLCTRTIMILVFSYSYS